MHNQYNKGTFVCLSKMPQYTSFHQCENVLSGIVVHVQELGVFKCV